MKSDKQKKLWKQNARDRILGYDRSNTMAGVRSIRVTKHTSEAPDMGRVVLKGLSKRHSNRKPSMPKMPWEKEDLNG